MLYQDVKVIHYNTNTRREEADVAVVLQTLALASATGARGWGPGAGAVVGAAPEPGTRQEPVIRSTAPTRCGLCIPPLAIAPTASSSSSFRVSLIAIIVLPPSRRSRPRVAHNCTRSAGSLTARNSTTGNNAMRAVAAHRGAVCGRRRRPCRLSPHSGWGSCSSSSSRLRGVLWDGRDERRLGKSNLQYGKTA
jgi:hypothetical protein